MKRHTVKGIKCPKCDDVIWSRSEHDLRKCKCKASFVDGGRDYLRIGGAAAIEQRCIVDIPLEPRDFRLWGSGGKLLTHREMKTDHILNCISHLHGRIEESEELETRGMPASFVEDRARLREIIDEFKEELALREVYNIPGEVH